MAWVGIGLLAILDGAAPECALRLIPAGEGQQDGQGDLALPEVVADRLAQPLLLGRIVQRIVDQLEGDAEVVAIGAKALLPRRVAAGDHRADLGRRGEQRGGLSLDHRQILFFGRGGVVLDDQLQHLAFRDGGGGFRQDPQHFERPIRHHHLEGAGEQEVAHQHGGLVAEQRIRASLAAPQRAFIHHIVMQQRRGVDELHAGR
jgi:hypothetical protein